MHGLVTKSLQTSLQKTHRLFCFPFGIFGWVGGGVDVIFLKSFAFA